MGTDLACLPVLRDLPWIREANLYVVDAAFENVQIFNPEGELLMHFGGSYEGAGAMWLPAAVEISYDNLSYFEPYVDESFRLKYLIYVTNQYGPAKLNVYGFVEEKHGLTLSIPDEATRQNRVWISAFYGCISCCASVRPKQEKVC